MKLLRCYLLATASSIALMGTATAADLPVKAQPAPPVAPVLWSWAGPYMGLNLGAAWNHAAFSDDIGPSGTRLVFPAAMADPFWSPTTAGFTIGGQAGYNWQTGNVVYGVEGDLNWVDSRASAIISANTIHEAASTKLDWMSSLRGRVGWAFSQVLVYGTGGVAFAHFSDAWGYAPGGGHDFTTNDVRVGWTAGGGLEYMITSHWTVRIEGLYADYGSKDLTVVNPTSSGLSGSYSSTFRHTVSTARAALNWKW
jgi:outer membrane immunogenic protein